MSKPNNTYVAIMAGGVGSRFWPASREARPKQFLDILGVGKSLIRLTYERFLSLCPSENILIVTNKQYKDLVKEHIPELEDHQILCEPSRNNTAPCVCYTSLRLKAQNPDATFVIAPSDHVILKEQEFLDRIREAASFAHENKALLTLGIQPTRPDTGYGYINYDKSAKDVFPVKQFMEKPNRETAQEFLDS
ncbi:MAG: mannose-1-phosphate guanylyltransferase, partial [Saprospiraceae bacterium]